MNQIQFTARFSDIPSANIGAFKELAAQAIAITRSEAGALRDDWFFNEELAVGGGCTFDVCGFPSPELVAATDGLQLNVFSSHLQVV